MEKFWQAVIQKPFRLEECRVWSIKNCKNIFHYCVNKNQKNPKLIKSVNYWHLSHSKMVHNLFVSPFSWIVGQILSKKKLSKFHIWPDLAPYHYSNENQEWMKENSLTFVPKLHNSQVPCKLVPLKPFGQSWNKKSTVEIGLLKIILNWFAELRNAH